MDDIHVNIDKVLLQFKTNLVSFIDELIDKFPKESNLIIYRIYINNQCEINTVIDIFVYHLIKSKEQLKARDENYFLDHEDSILGNIQSQNLNLIKKVWRSTILDTEDKNTIWKWADAFLFFAEKYVRLKQAKLNDKVEVKIEEECKVEEACKSAVVVEVIPKEKTD